MSLIHFICRETGQAATASVTRETGRLQALEAVACPCCARIHVLDTATSEIVRSADLTLINLMNYFMWSREQLPAGGFSLTGI